MLGRQPNLSARTSILTVVADIRSGGRVTMTTADKGEEGVIFPQFYVYALYGWPPIC